MLARLNLQCEWLWNLQWMWWEIQLNFTSFQTTHKRTVNDATFHAAFLLLPRCNWLVSLAPEAASAESPVVADVSVASDDRLGSTANGEVEFGIHDTNGSQKRR